MVAIDRGTRTRHRPRPPCDTRVRRLTAPSHGAVRRRLVAMEPRIDLLANELGAKIAKRIFNVSLAIAQSPLPATTQALVSLRASQINGCGWCVDVHTKEAARAGETQQRLHLVAAWRHAAVFTEAERAALALTDEGTRLADAGGVSD